MTEIDKIKQMLQQSKSAEAIEVANQLVQRLDNAEILAQAYYLRGNAYRQQGDMRQAMNSYLESMELLPDGPAAQAYRTIQEILDFYNRDLYNP